MPVFNKSAVQFPEFTIYGWLFTLVILYSAILPASGQATSYLHSIALQTLAETKFKFPQYPSGQATVIVFLSDECPLSQNYTLTLQTLYNAYHSSGINFYAVFPGKYIDRKAVSDFTIKYTLTFPVLLDKRKKLVQQLGASVTPEVFLLDNQNELIYRGSIDNWASDLGKKRQEITRHYLKEAIIATLSGQALEIKTTKPVGCYIE
jgi:thiol-disulfide isomerase/thioredoxin